MIADVATLALAAVALVLLAPSASDLLSVVRVRWASRVRPPTAGGGRAPPLSRTRPQRGALAPDVPAIAAAAALLRMLPLA